MHLGSCCELGTACTLLAAVTTRARTSAPLARSPLSQLSTAASPPTPAGRRSCTAATACLYATENGGPCRCFILYVTLLCGRGGGKVVHGARKLASRVSGRYRRNWCCCGGVVVRRCVFVCFGGPVAPSRRESQQMMDRSRWGRTHGVYGTLAVFELNSHPALPALRHATVSATGLTFRGLGRGEGRERGARGVGAGIWGSPQCNRPGLRLPWTHILNKPPG